MKTQAIFTLFILCFFVELSAHAMHGLLGFEYAVHRARRLEEKRVNVSQEPKVCRSIKDLKARLPTICELCDGQRGGEPIRGHAANRCPTAIEKNWENRLRLGAQRRQLQEKTWWSSFFPCC